MTDQSKTERLRELAEHVERIPSSCDRCVDIPTYLRAYAALLERPQEARGAEFTGGAVPVLNPQGTGETGDDRPAAPISSIPHEPLKTCGWAHDEDGVWQTNCGESFVLTDGNPQENGMRFCCYCGNPFASISQTKSGNQT